jgi:hypothetical protein
MKNLVMVSTITCALPVFACSGAQAQRSPIQDELLRLAEVVRDSEVGREILPPALVQEEIAALKGMDECSEAVDARIALDLARAKAEKSDTIESRAAAKLALAKARLARSQSSPQSEAQMASAVEQVVAAAVQATISRNRSTDYPGAVANFEIVRTLCASGVGSQRLEAIRNEQLVTIVQSQLPLLRTLRAKTNARALAESFQAMEGAVATARLKHAKTAAADAKTRTSNLDSRLLSSRKALDAALANASRGL